ncbi:MAG: hypothetical protein CMI16_02830 [Opitutaceae bacterium]|nr:hypothetical protein [Opitutaceae bacterium]
MVPAQGRVEIKNFVEALAEMTVFNEILQSVSKDKRIVQKATPSAPLLRPMALVTQQERNGRSVVVYIDFAGGYPEFMERCGAVGFFKSWGKLGWTPQGWRQAVFPIRLQGCDPRAWINQVLSAYANNSRHGLNERPYADHDHLEAEIVVRVHELLHDVFDHHWQRLINVTSPSFPSMVCRLFKLYNFHPSSPHFPYVPNELPAYSCYLAERTCKGTTHCMKLGCTRCNLYRNSKCIFLPTGGGCSSEDDHQIDMWSAFLKHNIPIQGEHSLFRARQSPW